jgi:hypothetical protein
MLEEFAARVAAIKSPPIGVLAVSVDNMTGARVHIRPDDFLRHFTEYQRGPFLDMEELRAVVHGVEFFALVEKEEAPRKRVIAQDVIDQLRAEHKDDLLNRARGRV